jgi:Ran GTPase-activating protein (RanGAP) involved in mRNA processing and transport
LSSNELNDDGVSAVCEAIQSNKETKLASLNMGANGIGPVGAKSVAAMVAITGALTRVDVRYNNIAGDGAAQLAAAVLGNLKIEMFNEIPLKEMRADSLMELDLNGKDVGVEGGMVVAGLIPVMGALTVTNLLGNQLDAESAKMLAEVAKQKGISLCGIRRDQTTADFRYQELQPPDAILLGSDLSQAVVTGMLTKIE